jgi:hypothetical protein
VSEHGAMPNYVHGLDIGDTVTACEKIQKNLGAVALYVLAVQSGEHDSYTTDEGLRAIVECSDLIHCILGDYLKPSKFIHGKDSTAVCTAFPSEEVAS